MIALSELDQRDNLGEWLNRRGLLGIGVEVGSLCGEFARTIISKWNGQKLIMLDPWEKQSPDVYREFTNNTDFSGAMASCESLWKEYPERIVLMRDYSPKASVYFQNFSLDWVYLDGNHSYEAVSEDLRAWWPKVRPGGLFGGHDFRTEVNELQCCDVKTAIEDWCKEYKLPLPYITRHPGCYSWWITKNS